MATQRRVERSQEPCDRWDHPALSPAKRSRSNIEARAPLHPVPASSAARAAPQRSPTRMSWPVSGPSAASKVASGTSAAWCTRTTLGRSVAMTGARIPSAVAEIPSKGACRTAAAICDRSRFCLSLHSRSYSSARRESSTYVGSCCLASQSVHKWARSAVLRPQSSSSSRSRSAVAASGHSRLHSRPSGTNAPSSSWRDRSSSMRSNCGASIGLPELQFILVVSEGSLNPVTRRRRLCCLTGRHRLRRTVFRHFRSRCLPRGHSGPHRAEPLVECILGVEPAARAVGAQRHNLCSSRDLVKVIRRELSLRGQWGFGA
eukprot:scaffold240947_cov27-Tisochrysis_lutea.AAC.3